MQFNELGLMEPVVRGVADEGYTTPTPIQTEAIPAILGGRDVLGCAQTGAGKTGAFAMPILHRLASADGEGRRRSHRRAPRALVLCPTRELATQISESFGAYGRHLPLRRAVVFGGVSQSGQVRALASGVDILVATPGRLLDLMNQRRVDLRSVEILVLDEADRMLDMGFIRDIRRIVDQLPKQRQTLFFSATMVGEIRRLADFMLRDPVQFTADRVASAPETIEQSVYLVPRKNKPILLERLLRRDGMDRTLVFTRTKHGADRLVKSLGRSGLNAVAIHGNKTQNARTRALDGFKSGRTNVLIATDIAARGIDVDEITHVINFDLPNVPETYVHRIGRTARAGAAGAAVSFCDHEEVGDLRAIERLIQSRLDVQDGEPDLVFEASEATRTQRGPHSPSRSRPGNGASRRRGGDRAGTARRSRARAGGRGPRRSNG